MRHEPSFGRKVFRRCEEGVWRLIAGSTWLDTFPAFVRTVRPVKKYAAGAALFAKRKLRQTAAA
jgi:hypothetical protein